MCEEVKIVSELLSQEIGIHGEELTMGLPLENHQLVSCGCASQRLSKQAKMVLAGNLGVAEEA